MKRALFLTLWLGLAAVGCRSTGGAQDRPAEPDAAASLATLPAREDAERDRCRMALTAVEHAEPLPGAPDFEKHRAALLGRARGHAVYWLTEPQPVADGALPERARALRERDRTASPYQRLRQAKASFRGDKATLRALVLRDGYLYSAEPAEALALVNHLALTDLFDETELWRQRGAERTRLRRTAGRYPEYVVADGERAGQKAQLLLGDRVALTERALDAPLHVDVQDLAHASGAERIQLDRVTDAGIDAQLRFGDTWVRALLGRDGARLHVRCLDAPAPLRRTVDAWQRADAPRRSALSALRGAVDAAVDEALPFDRPRGVKDHLSDGKLRPLWRWAYLGGHQAFEHDAETYAVFDAAGRPAPPQMCVDFVLDTFERAAGTWYASRGEERRRIIGSLDFDAFGLKNRSGVIAFGDFAAAHPEHFLFRRFTGAERIPFGDRDRFFAFLVAHGDELRAGDVVAIHGKKADGYIHQHAILIEDTDPITGMPHALADQMRWPRRRTWEGIMAEAPQRSLYFRARPLFLAERLYQSAR